MDHPVIPKAPSQGLNGISMVTGMIDGMLNDSTDMADVNGDGKTDVDDVTTLIDRLLSTK